MDYYKVRIRLDDTAHFVIWCGNDDETADSLFVVEEGVMRWSSAAERDAAADAAGLTPQNETDTVFDFDHAFQIVEVARGRGGAMDDRHNLSTCLSTWNFLSDVSNTPGVEATDFRQVDETNTKVHSLLSEVVLQDDVLKAGRTAPSFREVDALSGILDAGLKMLRGCLAA